LAESKTLEQELITGFQENLSRNIMFYCADHDCTITVAAQNLGLNRNVLQHYKSQDGIPPWEMYFTIALKLDGQDATAERVKRLVDGLQDYFVDSMKTYVAQKGIQRKDLTTVVGVQSDTSIYVWMNRKQIPRGQDLLKALAGLYTEIASPAQILEPITDYQQLESKKYKTLIDHLKKNKRMAQDSMLDNAQQANGAENLQELDPKARAQYTRTLMHRLSEVVNVYRKAPVEERDVLRRVCNREMQEIGFKLAEARQLLRPEERYQEWLGMNQQGGGN
jgi:hypothetical protein